MRWQLGKSKIKYRNIGLKITLNYRIEKGTPEIRGALNFGCL
ncbi:hypothetical protein MOOTH_24710 [Moorella thermoacetica]|nr:hypothetical protein MOOTH_24710 [Moorella thermoacetica]